MRTGRRDIGFFPAEFSKGVSRAMFRVFALSVILLSSFSVFASPPGITAPSLSSFPDTEATTNVAFNAGGEDGRIFRLSIQLNASASNNVVVAFGHDANENGVLDRAEADMLVGCDAGRCFCHDRVSGFSRAVVREDCPRQLDWKLILNARREAKALSASDENGVVFDESVPITMFGSNWNLMSVTARGLDDPHSLVVSDVAGWGSRVILR